MTDPFPKCTPPADLETALRFIEEDSGWGTLSTLLPFLRPENIDAIYAGLSPRLRSHFLDDARDEVVNFDHTLLYRRENGIENTADLETVRDWVHRQPFAWCAKEPLPEPKWSSGVGLHELFARVLPHLLTKSVEAVLYELHPLCRARFAGFAAGFRPGLDVVVATARALGQDPTPFFKLDAWEASLPEDEKYPKPHPTVKPPVRPPTTPAWVLVVDEHNAAYLSGHGARRYFSDLDEHLRPGLVDEIALALHPDLRPHFLESARWDVFMFDEWMVGYQSYKPVEVRDALGEWVCRQPFTWAPLEPLPPGRELGLFQGFLARIFPHLVTTSVEDVLRVVDPVWERTFLPVLIANFRPVVDELVATCRAHDQDPTPILKLVDWDDRLRRANKHRPNIRTK